MEKFSSFKELPRKITDHQHVLHLNTETQADVEEVIYNISKRVEEMIVFHYQRLADIVELCKEEKTLFEVTDEYYKLRSEYINGKTVPELARDEQVLALEEIRAHLDYLIEDSKIIFSKGANGVIKYHSTQS